MIWDWSVSERWRFWRPGTLLAEAPTARPTQRALEYVLDHAKPSGLLNISSDQRDLYNHGLATFVLGQAHGMTTTTDRRLNAVLDRALKLIVATQCQDGGWDYRARSQARGHDLSLAVMQAKALRSAMDSGLDVPPSVVDLAILSVREHYCPTNGRREAPEREQMQLAGQFTYSKGGGGGTTAMAAAGVVCLQEFGQYDDWRIPKNMELIVERVRTIGVPRGRDGTMPFDAYTLYYVGQALYQVNGDAWRETLPPAPRLPGGGPSPRARGSQPARSLVRSRRTGWRTRGRHAG